jgi:hypothetical protein
MKKKVTGFLNMLLGKRGNPKDAEKHKSRHLFFKFYMKLVVKLFFCGRVNEEGSYRISYHAAR